MILFSATSVIAETSYPAPKTSMNFEPLRSIVILEGGRKKPLDTFARETVRMVTGREKFAGFDPLELIFSWLTESKSWEKLPILEASYRPLQEKVGLKVSEGRISPEALKANQEFNLLFQTVASKQQSGAKLTELEQNTMGLMQRLSNFYKIASGASLTLVPQSGGPWESLGSIAERYPDLKAIGGDPALEAKIAVGVQGLLSAYFQNDAKLFNQVSGLMVDLFRRQGEKIGGYPQVPEIAREIHFNKLKPFRLAWLGYALAFFILLSSLWLKGKKVYGLGMFVLLAAFAMHVYGFYLRIVISGRAPVTNMYETVIWVSLGIVFFATVFEAIYKAKYYAVAAAALATLGLVLADSAPAILDPAINPLVPVLRSNYWLTIHVLTITLSYAAFALALGVGHVSMGYYIFKPDSQQKVNQLNYFLYRSIQVGVVLLAAGTILGGVWANASWGRFWGWDPKEVWALIALLGYLAILHGRYAGWLSGFGLAVGSILAFLLVMMAWYGVNFVLGVGLHSYGFSSGGALFMSIFVISEFIWVGFAVLRYKVLFNPATS